MSSSTTEGREEPLRRKVLERSVLKLRFRIPDQFRYTAGQYIRLKCDNINDEWHPFTISSAPEDDFIQLNIRCDDSMDWCSELRKLLVPIKARRGWPGFESMRPVAPWCRVKPPPLSRQQCASPLGAGSSRSLCPDSSARPRASSQAIGMVKIALACPRGHFSGVFFARLSSDAE